MYYNNVHAIRNICYGNHDSQGVVAFSHLPIFPWQS